MQTAQAVFSALSWSVLNGTLTLELTNNFTTTNFPVSLLVGMPPTALQTISHYGPGARNRALTHTTRVPAREHLRLPSLTRLSSFPPGRRC